jgi:predicted dehydrogenase
MAAMERGIHVYTQKPLTHNIWQARTLRKAKGRYKVITQMGNQGHAKSGTRRAVEAYRAGLIGDVGEVLAGNDGPRYGTVHWVFPETMPPNAQPVPTGLNYDLWLGPAAERPFSDQYLPQKWRSFYDFGCGVLGDFGCHTLDVPVWALELENPTSVEAVRRSESAEGVMPKLSTIVYRFPGTEKRGPVTLTWYSGKANGNEWPIVQEYGFNRDFGAKGAVMVGSKGLMQTESHGGEPRVYPVEVRQAMKDKAPKELFPRVAEDNPFKEWLDAITGNGPEPGSNFDYASNLTELVLLGALAERFNARIEWDGERGIIKNHAALNAFVKEPARQGWAYGEGL